MADRVAIRHVSGHEIVAMVEIISPGNKSSRHGLASFVRKSVEALQTGVHLLVIDLFPPSVRDPQGIHKAIWDEIRDNEFVLPSDKQLTLISYISGLCPEAYIQPVAVGDELPDMPVFLTEQEYVPVPLAATYDAAWAEVPEYWRTVVSGAL